MNVTLTGLSHTYPDDIDILLVRPGASANATVMSDAGGSLDVNAVNLTLDDEAAAALPDAAQIVTGSYQPANYEGADPFPAPAPAPSGNVALSTFDGGTPNGTWSLYLVDDAGARHGQPDELVAVDHDLRRPTTATSATSASASATTTRSVGDPSPSA